MDFNISSFVFSINKTSTVKPVNSEQTKQFEVETNVANNNQNALAKEVIALPQTAATASIMNNIQMNMFLREMLNLPKEWAALLSEFTKLNGLNVKEIEKALSNLNNNSRLAALLQINPKVDLEAIAKLIASNSTQLTDKMVKLMAGANFDKTLINQMKEISLIGSSIATALNINQTDFIRSIVQMYLPWLPFVPPEQRDNTERLTEAFSDEEVHASSQTSFFLTTVALGYFKFEIAEDNGIEIFVTRIAEKIDESDDYLNKIINDVAKKYFKDIEFSYFSKEKICEDIKKEKELHIISSSNSAIALMLIQMLSRKIFETDDNKIIDNNRLTKLENPTPNE